MSDDPPGLLDRQPSDLAQRTAVGLGLIAIAIVALWIGGIVLWLLAATLAVAMLVEWCGIAGASAPQLRIALAALAVVLILLLPFGSSRLVALGPSLLSLAAILLAAGAVLALTRSRQVALGLPYVALPVLALLLIRDRPEGVVYTLWTLATVWLTDIGGYFAGRAIGGPKLAPAISPNKTWAGLIGGVVLASLLAIFLHWYAGLAMRLTLATPVLAVAAQAGDLYESRLKRRAGVKDSGNLLPGHGGVLDRLDGLVPVAPLAALLVVLPHLYP